MKNPVWHAIESRSSALHFAPERPLDDALIATLVQLATCAPSAYNFQNWRFIAVRTPEGRERLKAIAYGQQKVVDAAVAFVVCGRLAAHEQLASTLQPSVAGGQLPQAVADAWVRQATAAHEGNLALQRDEAIRSASLAAMTLMLAAQGLGLASCPMAGFDAEALAQAFELGADEVPVMLVAVGHAVPERPGPKWRRPVEQVLSLA